MSLFISATVFGQHQIEWAKHYGGDSIDFAQHVIQTSDGGYLISGTTYSTDQDAIGNHGGSDMLLVKTFGNGDISWTKPFGGDTIDGDARVIEIPGTGYYLYGLSRSDGTGDVSNNYGGITADYWVVKMDYSGNIIWEKNFGGIQDDFPKSAVLNGQGGIMLCGLTKSPSGADDITFKHGQSDFWLLNLDGNGNKLWDSCYGGAGVDEGFGICATPDGGYILSGSIRFFTSNPTPPQLGQVTNYYGSDDLWIVKINANGQLLWQRTIGGNLQEKFGLVTVNPDGNIYVACQSNSSNNGIFNHGLNDILIAKLDAGGNILWTHTYGGSGNESPTSIINNFNGVIILGTSGSSDGDINGNLGFDDFWMIKLSNNGVLLYEENIGGSMSDAGNCITATSDGSFVLAGGSLSSNDDVPGNYGLNDFFVTKLRFCNTPMNYQINAMVQNDTLTAAPLLATFYNTTPGTGGLVFTWTFGDGTILISNDSIITHTYPSNGYFPVGLTATDTLTNCSETIFPALYIYCNASNTPNCTHNALIAAPDTISACANSTVSLHVNVSGTTNYLINWYHDGNLIQGQQLTTLNALAGGSYYAMVPDMDNGGCAVNSNIIFLEYNQLSLPTPVITQDSVPDFCASFNINLIAPPGYTSYLWNDNSTNDTLNITEANSYFVTVFNSIYCNATSNEIQIFTSNITPPEICNVTVDTTTNQHILVYWNYGGGNGLDSVLVYRKFINGTYQLAGAVSDTVDTFYDPDVNAVNGVYKYKLQIKHYCSPASFPDSASYSVFSSERGSNHLVVQPGNFGDMLVLWTEYPGVTDYYILRDTSLTSSLSSDFVIIDSIPAPSNNYFDLNPNFGSYSRYRVEANTMCDRAANRNRNRSNTNGLSAPPVMCMVIPGDTTHLFPPAGGSHSVNVATSFSNCDWLVTDTISWLSINLTGLVTGDSILTLDASPCSGGGTRQASLFIDSFEYIVQQNCCAVPTQAAFIMADDTVCIPYFLQLSEFSSVNGQTIYTWTIQPPTGAPIVITEQSPDSVLINQLGIYSIGLEIQDQCGQSVFLIDTAIVGSCIVNLGHIVPDNHLKLYPNPANEQLKIVAYLPNDLYYFEISDVLGQVVTTKAIDVKGNQLNEQIDLENYASGTYLVRLFSDHSTATGKFIKQ